MSCGCKNKEFHPCQNGGECQCGGKCKQENYSNAVGSLNEFKDESKSIGKGVLFLVGGLILASASYIIYTQIK
jgi:hypothetical protein